MICDLKAAEIILAFSVGGITLRGAIALVKAWLKLTGTAALLVSVVMCLIASAIYLVLTQTFDVVCLFLLAASVFSGSQITFQATKKNK